MFLSNEMDEKMNKELDRIKWIDIAKGIGIISVLVGHACSALKPIIYAFHMPLFFVLTGYTIKKIDKKDIIQATIIDLKRLIAPCVIARLIILFGNCILKEESIYSELQKMISALLWGINSGDFWGIPVSSIGRMWFLPALFWTKFFYRLLALYFDEKKRLYILIPLSFVSMFLGSSGIVLPQNIDMIFICMLFVEIGSYLKRINLQDIKWWVMIALFAVWTFFSMSQGIWISMNMRQYPGYGMCIVVAIAAIICVFLFCQSIDNSVFSIPFLFYGKYSLVLLIIESVAPFFYSAKTIGQNVLFMIVKLLLVIVYALFRKVILNRDWLKKS